MPLFIWSAKWNPRGWKNALCYSFVKDHQVIDIEKPAVSNRRVVASWDVLFHGHRFMLYYMKCTGISSSIIKRGTSIFFILRDTIWQTTTHLCHIMHYQNTLFLSSQLHLKMYREGVQWGGTGDFLDLSHFELFCTQIPLHCKFKLYVANALPIHSHPLYIVNCFLSASSLEHS